MSRTLRKAVEAAKQKKETEINLPDEGIAHLAEVRELCESEQDSLASCCSQTLCSYSYAVGWLTHTPFPPLDIPNLSTFSYLFVVILPSNLPTSLPSYPPQFDKAGPQPQ